MSSWSSPNTARRFQHLFRPRADAEILGEVAPAHDAISIDQKLSGPSDVVSARTLSFVNEVVSPDGLGVGIGEERKGVAGFLDEIARFFRRVDADRNRLDAGGPKLGEMLFNTP
jgi:hypothetical protein